MLTVTLVRIVPQTQDGQESPEPLAKEAAVSKAYQQWGPLVRWGVVDQEELLPKMNGLISLELW